MRYDVMKGQSQIVLGSQLMHFINSKIFFVSLVVAQKIAGKILQIFYYSQIVVLLKTSLMCNISEDV